MLDDKREASSLGGSEVGTEVGSSYGMSVWKFFGKNEG